jgi:hypothetical protein
MAPAVLYLVQHLPNVVEVHQATWSHIDRFGSKGLACFRPAKFTQAAPQGRIDRLLEGQILPGAPGFKLGGHIVVKAQRGPHTSQHNTFDELMPGLRQHR